MKRYDVTVEQIAQVCVVQREWAGKNPRATFREPITVEDVLSSRMIAYPFRLLMCCLVTDGGGALILTSAERARDFPTKPVYILGTGESVETPDGQSDGGFYLLARLPCGRPDGVPASRDQPQRRRSPDDLRRLRASALVPLEDLGFVPRGEAARFIGERHTAPGGKLPLNTNGGGLSYMHSGMYGMYALQESVRQMRGIAPAQVPGAKISVCHGVGGMFAASGTIIFSNEAP